MQSINFLVLKNMVSLVDCLKGKLGFSRTLLDKIKCVRIIETIKKYCS